MAAQLEVHLEPFLQQRQAQLGQPRRLHRHERQVAQVGERLTPPRVQRLAVQLGGLGRVALGQLPGSHLERVDAMHVHRSRAERELVAAGLGGDRVGQALGPERLADLEHQVLEDLRGRAGRVVAPDRVDERAL